MTTVCLTFDFDAVSLWVSTFRQVSATPVSRGEYGANVGLPRVLALLESKGIPATFFVPAHTAASFPAHARRIVELGHEIGVHGYCHESPVDLSRDDEAALLDRSVAKLRTVLGDGFRPLGYRSPAWDLSSHSVGLLEERGFLYDSSLMADDFRPYLARRGDRVDDEMFVPGEPSGVIEFPVAWELDDFPYFSFLNRPLYQGLRSTEDVQRNWQGEFDYCHSEIRDGVFTLTMHPQVIGRGPRMAMLERLIEHMRAQPDVRFSTLGDEATRRRETLR